MLFVVFFTGAGCLFAQSVTISGRITDKSTGEALPGANVYIKALQRGAASNPDGKYEISNVPPGSYTLTVSFIGYDNYSRKITVGVNNLTEDISLTPSTAGLNEVVVNALGFKEERSKSAASVSTVKGTAVANSGESNLITGLSAKAPGVYINQTGGDPGAGASILIRGQSTITGNNQPLFVVDGMPISNAEFNFDSYGGVGVIQPQVRSNDINPDDIASISILKGAAAAALWGSRAANGVIIITTKEGAAGRGHHVHVSVSSETSFDHIDRSVPLQTTFGQGTNGHYEFGNQKSWGDKIADRKGGADIQDFTNGNYGIAANGTKYGTIPSYGDPGYENNVHGGKNSKTIYDHSREMFHTAPTYNNSVSISGGNTNGTYYLNATNLTQDGIIKKNSNYKRTSLRANVQQFLSQQFTFNVHTNYVNMVSDRIQQGSNLSAIFLGGLRTPPDFNNAVYLINYVSPSGTIIKNRQRSYRNPIGASTSPIYDNPNFSMNKEPNRSAVSRFIGSSSLSYDPTPWLDFTYRIGIDTYTNKIFAYYPVYSGQIQSGSFDKEDIQQTQINSDLIARASHTFSKDFSGSLLLGANVNSRNTDQIGATVTNFFIPDAPPNMANSPSNSRTPYDYIETVRTAAVYGEAKLNMYDMLYFDFTGRGESASTFGNQTSSNFFYPSASLAWQFTQLKALKDNPILSFGKLRLSYGQVGRQPDPYNTQTIFVPASSTYLADGWGSAIDAANYNGGYIESGTLGNSKLKPERKTEYDVGVDLRFFKSRLSLSGTYYYNYTKGAILPVATAPSTGFDQLIGNVGRIQNKGLELEVNATWLRKKEFEWSSDVNWSRNLNKVVSLKGTKSIFLNGFAGVSSRAVPGQPLGVLWGGHFAHDKNGKLIQDPTHPGFPLEDPTSGVIGNPNPDWLMGIGNTFTYKNFSLYVLVNIKQGGQIWNGTKGALEYIGTAAVTGNESTASQDLKTYGGGTIAKGTTFRGNIKDFGFGPVALDQSWYTDLGGGFGPNGAQYVEDGGYTRIQEVTLSYNLASEAFRNATGLSSIKLSVSGRNLHLWTKYDGIDPATNLTGATNGQGLDYFQNPGTRSFYFTVQVNY